MQTSTTSIVRIGKFNVPEASISQFLDRITQTHAFLSTLDGCLQNRVFKLAAEESVFNVMTLVEWRDRDAYEDAQVKSQERHRRNGVHVGALLEQLGVTVDGGDYESLPLG